MTKKIAKWIAVWLGTVIIAGVLFIRLDTKTAAEFTDNVLRPVLGAETVIFMEKVFFNAQDKVQQLTANQNNIRAPQFGDFAQFQNLTAGGMGARPIPMAGNFKRLGGEGIWQLMQLKAFPNEAVMAHTFVRPDPLRPFSIVTIVEADLSKLSLGAVAGLREPGGKIGNPGPGIVPRDIVESNRLVAAFDGGFQYRDGQYGMIVGDKTYLPLQKDLGTVVGYKNGTIRIIDYLGQNLGNDVAFVRQNCPVLILNGQLFANDERNKKLWGRTMTSSIFTWRTGMGLTKNGNLLFAVGNNLTPETLGKALLMAGAESAIQLDINPNWVRFNVFDTLGSGRYFTKTLTRDLVDGSKDYLNGNGKDFFYLYKK